MNLIIGATGMLGNEICRLLTKENKPLRAMVRETSDPIKVNRLKELGAEVRQGDLRDKSSMRKALHGISTVFTTASSMPFSYVAGENDPQSTDLLGMINLIDEARNANIKRFIYTSFSGNLDIKSPLRDAKRDVEQHLQLSEMVYTILRPSCFMEVWLTAAVGFDIENAKVQINGTGENPISYISYQDVAKFAVKSLTNMAARNAIIELGGPEKISQLNAVKIFEQVSGKKFEVQHTSENALRDQYETAEDPMQKSFASLMLSVAHGDPIDMNKTAEWFNIRLRSVKEIARSMVGVV